MTRDRAKVIGILVAVLAAFLIGFIPQYLSARSASAEVRESRQQLQLSKLRDLSSWMFLEVSRNNFGTAAEHASTFFREVRATMDTTQDPGTRQTLQQMLERQDEVTAGLATADAGIRPQIQDILDQMLRLGNSVVR